VLNCVNTRSKKHLVAHGLYYALNIASIKRAAGRPVPLPEKYRRGTVITFAALGEGAWQVLPDSVLAQIDQAAPQVIIKFGMGLLRVPQQLPCPILSYHHGDPRRFRGRPAGFYELMTGAPMVGQVVQLLSNRLDAGQIVGFAETRAIAHSYKATLAEAYRCSPLLLPGALRRCLSRETLPIEPIGANYRLPGNATVVRFLAKLVVAKVRRLLFGLFVERQWQVADSPFSGAMTELVESFPAPSKWRVPTRPKAFRFLADPFPHPEGGLLVEALRKSDEQGEIVHLRQHGQRTLCAAKGHFSYPGTVRVGDEWFMLPETAEWTLPTAYRLTAAGCEPVGKLQVEGSAPLIDPTLFPYGDAIYLFANKLAEGAGVLRLWMADELFGQFLEHPASPIRISPSGARMGGALIERGGRILRPGQDGSRSYGDAVILFEIERLTRSEYSERECGRIDFADRGGPHTLNLDEGRVVFDFYDRRVTPLAGVRRLRSLLSKRRARRLPA
jgi:hypothetical protein